MNRLAYLLLFFLMLVSCDNLRKIKKDKVTFYFTDKISEKQDEIIADAIIAEIKQLKLADLGIETVKVDSVPFSVILYIPYTNEVNGDVEEDFKVLSNLVSHFDLAQTPVHIILTDEKFNPVKNIPYDKGAVTYEGETMIRGRAEVKMSEDAKIFPADILEQVLRNRMTELYKGTDSVRISVDIINDTINIDLNFDQKQNNLDTLRKQFLATDRLFFDLLFDNRTVLFHVRNKQTRELITVFGLRGK